MQLTQPLHRAIACRARSVAIICGDRQRSFAEVGERVARLAGALQALGVCAGDRVGILMLGSDRYLEAYMAVWWAGAVVNPVNVRWSAAEIAYSLDDCDTRLLIVDDAFAAQVPELGRRSKALRHVVHAGDGAAAGGMASYEALIEVNAPVADAARGGGELAGVFYTGGTTGFPKGVMLSHESLALNALMVVAEGMVREGDVGLAAVPLFHIGGLLLTNALWMVGATQVLLPAYTAAAWMRLVEQHRVTTTILVPTMIQAMVDHPERGRHDLSSLRALNYGGSPIPQAVIERTAGALPGAALAQVYGQTELGCIATILGPDGHRGTALANRAGARARSGGRPSFGTQVRIVGADGRDCARGTVGEIVVRSPAAMLGYWNRSDATRDALQRAPNEGWMHTGDAGRMDEDGFVFVVDRVKDMIVTGGENVYSVEVEQAVAAHPAVAACAVIGVPDEAWGERVHAVVVARPGATVDADALRAHCKTLIGGYKCPRSVDVIDALPLTAAGKVAKNRLREPYWAGRERQVA